MTHWGLSGPAVLRASAWGARQLQAVHYQTEVVVNWLPQQDAGQLVEQLRSTFGARSLSNVPAPEGLTKRLWLALITRAGISPTRHVSQLRREEIQALIQQLQACAMSMTGKSTFKDEFVTAGGIDRGEVHWRTMASKVCPGLFVAGECIDVDAITGGFNFQHAWTSSYLAATAMG